jgi:fructokinase
VADVAWDRIGIDEAARQAAAGATALVFGSLAQRSSHNRTALQELLSALPREAWRVFDVNLRPPHDDLARVRTLARQCTLLKLNAEEAARLTTGAPTEEPGREEAQAHQLAIEHGCRIICITAGARGAGLLRDGHWHWEPGRTVDVSDTVGAGDSFLAALLTHLTAGAPPADALARACRVGEWVASRRGATPPYDSSTPR